MKRAIGLVLAILAFAVVAHADGIEYSRLEYAGVSADLRAEAPFTEALYSSNLLMGPGNIAFRAGGTFAELGDAERLTDLVSYAHFGDSAKAADESAEFDSIWRRLESIWVNRYDGRREYLRIEHSDPFRAALGVDDVPEPETLLLTGVGLAALAIWKRRTRRSERPFVRFF
jgi:hypothetical protein